MIKFGFKKFLLVFSIVISIWVPFMSAQVDEDLSLVKLKEVAKDFDINTDTGEIAAISFSEPYSLYIYGKKYINGDQADFSVLENICLKPSFIKYKKYKGQNYYIISSKEENALYIFDADAKKLLQRMSLGDISKRRIGKIYCSRNNSDPLVYIYYDSSRDPYAKVFSLEDMSLKGEFAHNSGRMVVSECGNYIYTANMTGGRYYRKYTKKKIKNAYLKSIFIKQDNLSNVFTKYGKKTVYNRITDILTYKENLIPKSLYEKKDHKGIIIARDNLPYFFSYYSRGKQVVTISSVNTFKLLKSISLPEELVEQRASRSRGYYENENLDLKLITDVGRSNLYIAKGKYLTSYSLAKLPEEPCLSIKHDIPSQVEIGKEYNCKLEYENGVKVVVNSIPKGMKVEGKKISWKVNNSHLGDEVIEFEAINGEYKVKKTIIISVTQPAVAIPYKSQKITISPDGKLGYCPSYGDIDSSDKRNLFSLMLIDLENRKFLLEKKFTFTLRDMDVDDKYVYLLPDRRSFFLVLDKTSLKEVKKIILQGIGYKITSLANKFVLVDSHGIYRLPDFTKISGLNDKQIGKYKDQVFLQKFLFNKEFNKVDLNCSAATFPAYYYCDKQYKSQRCARMYSNYKKILSEWDRTYYNDDLESTARYSIAKIGYKGWLDAKLPVAVTSSVDRDKKKGLKNIYLNYYSLIDGNNLFDAFIYQEKIYGNSDTYSFKTYGSRVYMVKDFSVYICNLPEDKVAQICAPLYFEKKQSILFLPSKSSDVVLKHSIVNQSNRKIKYSLLKASENLKINKDNGDVVVNTSGLYKEIMTHIETREGDITFTRDDYIRKNNQTGYNSWKYWFKTIAEKELEGIPCSVPISVKAECDDGQVAMLEYYIVLELDKNKYFKKNYFCNLKEQNTSSPKRILKGATKQYVVASISSRKEKQFNKDIENLEDQVKSLEKKMDGSVDKQDDKIKSIDKDSRKLEGKIKSYEKKVDKLEEKIDALESRIEFLIKMLKK